MPFTPSEVIAVCQKNCYFFIAYRVVHAFLYNMTYIKAVSKLPLLHAGGSVFLGLFRKKEKAIFLIADLHEHAVENPAPSAFLAPRGHGSALLSNDL